jgi:hypothetical protein
MDGAPFMPDRQIATRDLRGHSRNGETVSNSEFVNSLLDRPANGRLAVVDYSVLVSG